MVLEGQAREHVAAPLGLQRTWQTASAVAALALALTLLLGAFVVRRLTRPLRELAQRMHDFHIGEAAASTAEPPAPRGDEVHIIASAFEAMAARIRQQLAEQAERDRRTAR